MVNENTANVKLEHKYDHKIDQYKVKLQVGGKELEWKS